MQRFGAGLGVYAGSNQSLVPILGPGDDAIMREEGEIHAVKDVRTRLAVPQMQTWKYKRISLVNNLIN